MLLITINYSLLAVCLGAIFIFMAFLIIPKKLGQFFKLYSKGGFTYLYIFIALILLCNLTVAAAEAAKYNNPYLLGGSYLVNSIFIYLVIRAISKLFKKVNETESHFHNMIDEVQDYGIIFLDKNGNIETWNTGAEKIKKYKAKEIIGKNFRIFYTKEDRNNKKPEHLLQKAIDERCAKDEGWRVRKDGTAFWASITITSIHDDNNNLIGFTKVTRDLTEKKLAEDTFKQYTHQLETKNRELEQFNYIASHDLQEPLHTLKSLTTILSTAAFAEKLNEDEYKILNFINDTTDRMSCLIKSLLDYGQLGKDHTLQNIDCKEIIDIVSQNLYSIINRTKTIISIGTLPVIIGYKEEIRILFENLITNAIIFSNLM